MEVRVFYVSLSLLFFLLALKLHLSRKHKNSALPPSPPALPVIGHLHLLKRRPMHLTFYSLAKKYGPIISLRFGSRLVVLISSPSPFEEFFTKNDVVLANRPKLLLGKHLAYNHTTLLQAPYGDHWRNLRRMGAVEIFSTYRINKFVSIRKDEIKQLLIKLSHNSLQNFGKVELKSMFQELTFNIMMRMVAGKRYYVDDVTDEEEARQFREIMTEAVTFAGASNPGDFLPILNWIDGGEFEKTVIRLGKRMDMFLQGLVDEHKRKEDLESMNTMIGHLISLQVTQPEYYTDGIIEGLVLVMLGAAMSNLLNNPNTLKKARDELDTQVGEEFLLDETHLSKLQYLQNIISETLRLNPAAPLLVPHESSESCSVGGYNVPRDTILLVNAWAIHRDSTVWDDPTSFKPDRFDNEGEDRKLIAFGCGRRSCPGAGLAQRVVGSTLGSLIQCFEWKRVSEKEVDMTEGRGITLQKVVPLEAICKSRPIMDRILC
uniref:Cytochrome P450 n=2 Tax=Populus trichocarpa TaxID=3694 RepID=A0A2K1ZPI2_POPTR